VLVKSPAINLVIPAADAEPVNPPADDLRDALSAIYGADQDQLKKAKLAVLIKSYEATLESLNKVATVADFAQALSKSQTLKPADLRPLRDRLAQEIQVTLGTDPDAALDPIAAKTLLQKLINTLKGI
jgi:two-component sensor histidine kinase